MANDKRGNQDKSKKRSEVAPTSSTFDELERVFGHLSPHNWMRPWHWDPAGWSEMMGGAEGRIPRVDIIDRDNTLLVRAELPGIRKEDLDVSLSDNLLTISTQTQKESSKEEKGQYQRREIYRGSFSRSLTLPVNVDADNAMAEFKDGILELRFPKVEQAKRRSISIEG